MKHLCKRLLGVAFAALTLTACNDELPKPVNELENDPSMCILRGDDFQWEDEEADSRTSLTVEGNVAKFSWTAGDLVGVLPDAGAQVYFTIPEAEGGDSNLGLTATFDGGAWALKSENNYAAYYPFIKDFDLTRTAIPVVYTGQKQTGNNNTAHLGAFDYNAAHPTTTTTAGGVDFDFDHVGALVLFNFTVPQSGTELKNVTFSANSNEAFVTEGHYDLTLEGFPITPTQTSNTLTIGLEHKTTQANEEVTGYFMCAPVDLTNDVLMITVTDASDKTIHSAQIIGRELVAAKGHKLKEEPPYLAFSADNEQTLKLNVNGGYSLSTSLQYSIGSGSWNTVTAGEAIKFGGKNGILRFRGKDANGTATSIDQYAQFSFGTKADVSVIGDIRTLIDWENHTTVDTKNARFCNLFQDCTALTAIHEELLPATTLANACYFSMFKGCSSLTAIPEELLPATTLASNCYTMMFSHCTSLTDMPALPAATLANSCYERMFTGCASLTAIPEDFLQATTLANRCYSSMFSYCTGLTAISEGLLPAATLAKGCYENMFSYCTSLTTAPALPATTLAEGCYKGMFINCSSMATAPALTAATLANGCYEGMFMGCTSLTAAPELWAAALAENCYSSMFDGCSSLNSITMMATSYPAANCFTNWVNGVAETGTFTKTSSIQLSIGVDGTPAGWTVIEKSTGEDVPGMDDGGNYNE